MKSIVKMLIILSVLWTQNSITAQIVKVEIVATGLTCSMCSNAINKQLKKIPEIEQIDIDLNTNTFVLVLKKNNKIKPRILKESIEKAGFFVGSMIIFLDKDTQKISENFIFIDDKKSDKYKILDKGYITTKEYKKTAKLLATLPSYQIKNEDTYHLKAN